MKQIKKYDMLKAVMRNSHRMASSTVMKWNDLRTITGKIPRPRFGHRVAILNNFIVFMGGGNDLIIRDIHLYDYAQKKWKQPDVKGKVPPGVASFGLIVHNNNIIIFGGIDDNRFVSDGLFELDTNSWRWSQHFPSHDTRVFPPCARFGHSFVLADDNRAYLFGGITNALFDVAKLGTEILNDFYVLEISDADEFKWLEPICVGTPPSPRESHTCTFHKNDQKRQLVFYGGFDGTKKLNDIHIFDLNSNTWFNVINNIGSNTILPLGRSMHSAVCFEDKMIVFGGWIANTNEKLSSNSRNKLTNSQKTISNHPKDYITSNSVACFDLVKRIWIDTSSTMKESIVPSGRAGHAAALVGSRMFVFSGRDGYRKSRAGLQTCFSDMWVLDLAYAQPPKNITLEASTCDSLTIKWQPVLNADSYIIQIYVNIPVENVPTASKKEKEDVFTTTTPSQVPTSNFNSGLPKEPVNTIKKESRKRHAPPTNPSAIDMPNQPPPPPVSQISTNNNQCITPTKHPTAPSNLPALKVVNMGDRQRQPPNFSQPHDISGSTITPNINNMPTTNYTTTSQPISTSTTLPRNIGLKTIENLAGGDVNQIPVVNLSKMGLSLAQLSKSVTFVTTKGGNLVAQLPYDQLRNFFKLNQNTTLPASVSPQTNVTVALSNNSMNTLFPGSVKPDNFTNIKHPSNVINKNHVNNEPRKLITGWYDTCLVVEPKAIIKSYFIDNIEIRRYRDITYVNGLSKLSLIPGETYKVRVASINACGVGIFSEPVTFLLPAKGLLGPPGNVKLIKRSNGLFMEWDHPSKVDGSNEATTTADENQVEFVVYMASISDETNFTYNEVYCGNESQCLIDNEKLQSAYVDNERTVPAITFRIVTKNSNGTGPAIQVRWVQ